MPLPPTQTSLDMVVRVRSRRVYRDPTDGLYPYDSMMASATPRKRSTYDDAVLFSVVAPPPTLIIRTLMGVGL